MSYIGSDKPFTDAAKEYVSKGWDVVPLPPNEKRHPPVGYSGRKNKNKFADEVQIQRWFKCTSSEINPKTGKPRVPWGLGNIGVRPGREIYVGRDVFEAIGIDIDDYAEKNGMSEYKELAKELGALPDTWISSARTDLRSGVRWFLVPYGFEFKGKASNSIEIVQHIHRYGVVYPSWHPKTKTQYLWYEPGQMPNGRNWAEIPAVESLAVLPQTWFEYLLKGSRQTGSEAIDDESTPEELRLWVESTFGAIEDKPCPLVRHTAEKWARQFRAGADHHDPLVAGHWSLYCLGAEGHTGVNRAVSAIEKVWWDRLLEEGDTQERSQWIARYELLRSREGAVRKIKAQLDSGERELETDHKVEGKRCVTGTNNTPPNSSNTPPNSTAQPSDNYERNEDGNARHFLDLYGDNVRYVPNHPEGGGKWLVFQEDKKRWVVDSHNVIVRNMFRLVKQRQQVDAARLLANAQTPAQEATAKAWLRWATESGNKTRVTNSLEQATTFEGVWVKFEELDRDPYLLPVANGIIRFHTKAEREAGKPPFEWITDTTEIKRYMVTQNTNVPYIPFAEQKNHPDPEIRRNFRKFVEQMHTFLKNDMSPEVWDYTLRLLGFSILGINPKKAIFLVGARDTGKSTFQNMMNAALGDLSIWREPRILLDGRFKGPLAEALSRRVCMVGELGEKVIDAGLFKRITGNDEVSCELKNTNQAVTLRARCVLISGCNDAPDVPNVDEATKSRFVVIPFKHRVPSDKKDESAQDDLMEACKVPLLATLVESCAKAIVTGIQSVPDELQMETKVFVAGLSELSDFINDTIIQLPDSEWKLYAQKGQTDPRDPKPRWPDEKCIGSKELYAKYKQYVNANGMDLMSSHQFTRRMKAIGFVQDGSKNKDNQTRWLGVTFTKSANQVQSI